MILFFFSLFFATSFNFIHVSCIVSMCKRQVRRKNAHQNCLLVLVGFGLLFDHMVINLTRKFEVSNQRSFSRCAVVLNYHKTLCANAIFTASIHPSLISMDLSFIHSFAVVCLLLNLYLLQCKHQSIYPMPDNNLFCHGIYNI